MKTISGVLALLLLSGCQSGPIKLDAPGERRITAADAIKVALPEIDKERLDTYLIGRRPIPNAVATGELWRQVFVGGAGDPTFTIKSAELLQNVAGAGFTLRFTYSVEGELSAGGTTRRVRGEGTRAAAMAVAAARREAVELGILDVARQCADILAQAPRSGE